MYAGHDKRTCSRVHDVSVQSLTSFFVRLSVSSAFQHVAPTNLSLNNFLPIFLSFLPYNSDNRGRYNLSLHAKAIVYIDLNRKMSLNLSFFCCSFGRGRELNYFWSSLCSESSWAPFSASSSRWRTPLPTPLLWWPSLVTSSCECSRCSSFRSLSPASFPVSARTCLCSCTGNPVHFTVNPVQASPCVYFFVLGLSKLDTRSSGRMGWQAMAYYMTTTMLAAITGIVCVLAIHPGNPDIKKQIGTGQKGDTINTLDALLDLIRWVESLLRLSFNSCAAYTIRIIWA